jgi:hypothetical protein
MNSLLAEHEDFTERVLVAGRRGLGGNEVWSWLERQAEIVASRGRRRCHIAFNPTLRSELRITEVRRSEYAELGKYGKPEGWTGSAGGSDRGHKVAVIRANGLEHIRSLEAHEFGHILLQRDPHFWRAITRKALPADKCIERLGDDAGQLLLLPPSLLEELMEFPATRELDADLRLKAWRILPSISRAAIAPFRCVASRMASILIERRAMLFCYVLPTQPSLFDSRDADGRVEDRTTVSIPWTMVYRRHPEAAHRYMFSDRIGASRKVILSGDHLAQAAEKDAGPIHPDLVRRLAGKYGWSLLNGDERLDRVASVVAGARELHFVLCA